MLGQLKRIQLKLLFIFGLSAAITIAGCGGSDSPADAADFRRLLEGCAMFENFFILCENLR